MPIRVSKGPANQGHIRACPRIGKAIGDGEAVVLHGQLDPQGGPETVFIRWRQLLRRGRSQEGTAAVEFAIVLPILMLLTLGALDMGHMFYIDHLITNASREGARYAAKYTGTPTLPTSTQVSNYIKTTLNYNAFNLNNLTVTTTSAGTFPTQIVTVTVTAQKQWWVLGGLLGLATKTLTAQTAMNVEH